MMKKKIVFPLIVSAVSLLIVQCKKEKLQPAPEILQGITYADVQPIFTANCSCHMAGGSAVRKADLSTYQSAKSNGDLEEAIRTNMYTYFNGDGTKYSKVYSWIKGSYLP